MKKSRIKLSSSKSNRKPFISRYGLSIFLALSIISLNLSNSGVWIQSGSPSSVLAYATNISVNGLQESQNAMRSQNGSSQLALNSKLATAAQNKANDMAARNYWSHNTPEGNEPWVFISNAGYSYQQAGENLAYGFDSSSAVVQGWMDSPSHKANLLDPDYSEIGFGIANSANYQDRGPQTIVVAMYAMPASALPPQTNNTTPAPSPPAPKPSSPPSSTPTESPPASIPELKLNTQDQEEKQKSEPYTTSSSTSSNTPEVKSSFIDKVLRGQAPQPVYYTSMLVMIGMLWFTVQNAVRIKRSFIEGEEFVLVHPAVEVSLMTMLMVFLYASTTGLVK